MVFPAPVAPEMPTRMPGGTSNEMPRRTGAEPYEKHTFRRARAPEARAIERALRRSMTSGVSSKIAKARSALTSADCRSVSSLLRVLNGE